MWRLRSVQVEQDASDAYARQLVTVEAERAAYRAGITSSWTAGRARAIKAAKVREKGWCDAPGQARSTSAPNR